MLSLTSFFQCLVTALCVVSHGVATNPLAIRGYKFFDTVSGEEVVLRGIDYYPRPNNGPLNFNSMDYYTNEHSKIWKRDIAYFEELGVNAIRLYAVDPDKNHDAFMCALQAANIYVIVALARDCPTCAVTRDQAPKCYPKELKKQGQAVINEFGKYPNTLAFSAGNEVNHFAPLGMPEWNGICQKKFLRDMREYIARCPNLRNIPVGLIIADTDRDENVNFYNCQSDPFDKYENAEWLGLNSYVMCDGGAETYDEALGLKTLQETLEGYQYSIPILMTEFGCLSDSFPTVDGYEGQRTFLQAKWMVTQNELRNLFAGAFAFEYSIEKANAGQDSPYPFTTFGEQNYGIGYFAPENCNDINIPCEYRPLPSFDFLKQAYNNSKEAPLTTIDSFAIPFNRTGRNHCPESFQPLSSFQWEADAITFSTCPSKQESLLVCSALTEPVSHDGGSSFLDQLVRIAFWGLIVTLVYFLDHGKSTTTTTTKTKSSKWGKGKDDNSSSQESSNNSTGLLLSLTGMGSKKDFCYEAIESDSSSEELEI